MCELCENCHIDDSGRQIIEKNCNSYVISKWESKDIYGSIYEKVAEIGITYCPECTRKLGKSSLK